MKRWIFAAITLAIPLQVMTIEPLSYCEGWTGGIRWLSLATAPTDGDFELGTKLTLTGDPPNLNAVVQQLEPCSRSAYRAFLNYNIPCTNWDLDATYFHANTDDHQTTDNLAINQFFQNFLGGSFTSLRASGQQNINEWDLTVGAKYLVNGCLCLRPYVGVGYGRITRNMHVQYNQIFPTMQPGTLCGQEKCRFWGVGPTLGLDFSYEFTSCLSLEGRVGGGALIGRSRSRLAAEETEEDTTTTFNASDAYCRGAPFLENTLALVYRPEFRCGGYGIAIKAGYQTQYYFKVLDRINPFNGFVVNPNPFPVRVTGSLGYAAPFIEIALVDCKDFTWRQCPIYSGWCWDTGGVGLYGEAKVVWLKAEPNNDDLLYAILHRDDGSTKEEKTHFNNYKANGQYALGYRTCNDLDFRVEYFRFTDTSRSSATAGPGEFLRSIDASGFAFVDFQEANSRVNYDLHQWDLLAGKVFSLCRQNIAWLLSVGVRYTALERTRHDKYDGGVPSELTRFKTNRLRSRYHGAGPLARLEVNYVFCDRVGIVCRAAAACLRGHIRSTLNQVNIGDVGQTSNTLSTPRGRLFVPVVDVSAGATYRHNFGCGVGTTLEVGYQFTEYFRAINLVFPTFLTGLEQRSSDLKLHGPYVKLEVTF